MIEKHGVVALFEELVLLMELKGENPFKIRAYANGARALEALEKPLTEALADGSLARIKGIGPGLLADIKALVETGHLATYDALKAATPEGLLEMLAIPGLGPKKVKAIHEGLAIASVGELEYACLENRLVDLPGFGAKTQAKVLVAIAAWKRHRGRRLLCDVDDLAAELTASVAAYPGTSRAAVAGEVRRRLETVGRIVWVAASSQPDDLLAAFQTMPGVEQGGEVGQNYCHVKLTVGLEGELRVVGEQNYAYALLHHTGSVAFWEALQAQATARGLTLDATGLRRQDAHLSAATEEEVFAHVGLAPVPVELREEAAIVGRVATGPCPPLITGADLQGIFHVHTRYSDGEATVRDMALQARALGYRYIGISDHSEAAFYAHGLGREQITAQQAEIQAVNEELSGIRVLSGIEADILADGSLDYDDATLAGFDFVIGSIHSRFGQDRAAMTHRLVQAVSHPRLTMLGHMTGRLLLSREPYDFDLEAVLAAAATHGKIIELNANPHRLDLDWRDLGRVAALGLLISINPDAHSREGLSHTRYGVDMARKGGLVANQVFNTRPIEAILAHLQLSK